LFSNTIAGDYIRFRSHEQGHMFAGMLSRLLWLSPLAAGAAIPQASSYGVAFGNYFSTGPVADTAWIKEATTTLVLPELNKPHVGNMALWPGMGTSGGDLIQGLAISTVGIGLVKFMAARISLFN
jgi:hypothetical protein